MLDFHNHLMPGVDDGAASIEESRAGLKAMSENGVTGIITTPHIGASQIDRGGAAGYLQDVAEAWERLSTLAAAEFPRLKLARGFEVMLDMPRPKLGNSIFRLAGTAFALVEFPFMSIPPNSSYALREMRDDGWIPIIAHPERYANMESSMSLIEQWRDAGAYLQVNAGSLVGSYGSGPRRIVWEILAAGHADYMCSDYHSRGKCMLRAGCDEMKKRGLGDQLTTMVLNAKKIVRGERPAPVAPAEVSTKPGWKKVLPWS